MPEDALPLTFPKAVTFDCAQTIVEVHWQIEDFIGECMCAIGAPITEPERLFYRELYLDRMPLYLVANESHDPEQGNAFWRRVGEEWLERLGRPRSLLEPLLKTEEDLAYGEQSILFRGYRDVIPCFERLRSRGVRLAVVSNWDYTLHRVLRMFGYHRFLEVELASLEEGVEKPDPRLFWIALERLGIQPCEAVHIGDNPIDDVEGAAAAGMRSVLIDRTGALPGIRSLDELERALGWID